MRDGKVVWDEEDLAVVMRLPGGRRKSIRYLTSAECNDLALIAEETGLDRSTWLDIAVKLLGHENFEAAYRAGVFEQSR